MLDAFVLSPLRLIHSLDRADRDVRCGCPDSGGGRPAPAGPWIRITWRTAALLLCALLLICFPGCRRQVAGLLGSRPTPRVTATPDEILLPLPTPTPDELLIHDLGELGAAYGPRGEVLTLSGLSFELGRPFVTLSSERPLDALIALLRRYPETDLVIEGYTDSRGSRIRNILLSLERADVVRDILVKRGLDESRLLTRGMGPVDPIASNATPDGRAQNRRIEIVFSDSEGNFALAANQGSAS